MSSLAFHDHDQAAFAFLPHISGAAQERGFRETAPAAAPAVTPCEMPLLSRAGDAARVGGGPGDCRFSAWKGRSGRRYVVSCFAVGDEAALGYPDAVVIAVGPGRDVLGVRDAGPWGMAAALESWRDEMLAEGAVQLHVHLIAATVEDRRRAVADLTPARALAH